MSAEPTGVTRREFWRHVLEIYFDRGIPLTPGATLARVIVRRASIERAPSREMSDQPGPPRALRSIWTCKLARALRRRRHFFAPAATNHRRQEPERRVWLYRASRAGNSNGGGSERVIKCALRRLGGLFFAMCSPSIQRSEPRRLYGLLNPRKSARATMTALTTGYSRASPVTRRRGMRRWRRWGLRRDSR